MEELAQLHGQELAQQSKTSGHYPSAALLADLSMQYTFGTKADY